MRDSFTANGRFIVRAGKKKPPEAKAHAGGKVSGFMRQNAAVLIENSGTLTLEDWLSSFLARPLAKHPHGRNGCRPDR